MAIEVSLDRLALIIDFDSAGYGEQLDIEVVSSPLVNSFISYATNDETVIPEWHFNSVEFVKMNLGGSETDLFWHEKEPMVNMSLVAAQSSFVRLDFNPKRFRDNPLWFHALIAGLSELKSMMPYEMHASQADFAFTMTDEQGASNMWLWKLGTTISKVMYSRSSAVASKYAGKRTSEAFAKLYDKHQERVDDIVTRFRTEKNRLKRLIDRGLLDEEEYVSEIVPILDDKKAEEIERIPLNHWRFEVTIRTALFETNSKFNQDVVVERFLSKLEVRELDSISDPVVRAVALAIADDKVIKNKLPDVLRKQYSAIMKWSDVSGYYHNRHYRVVPTDELPEDAVRTLQITRTRDDELSNKLIEAWYTSVSSLQAEIDSYIN